MAAFDELAFDDGSFDALFPAVPSPTPGVEVPDHAAAAIGRLPQQFRKPRVESLLRILATPGQPLESALWQLLTQRSVANSLGVQLDAIGTIVGQPRGGTDDETYRVFLRARIAANRSRGTVEDILRVLNLILLDDSVQIEVQTIGPAFVEVRLTNVTTTDAVATLTAAFTQKSVSAGVRAVVVSSAASAATAFTLPYSLFVVGTVLVGATTFTATYVDGDGANPLTLFPAGSGLYLSPTLATEEILLATAVVRSGNNLTFTLSSPTLFGHAAGEIVIRYDGPLEQGWGNSTQAGHPVLTDYTDTGTTGGRLVDARE